MNGEQTLEKPGIACLLGLYLYTYPTYHAPISNSRRLSLSGENSPNSSAFYEVLYVGKIRISSKRTVKTFIDDSVNRFKTQEAERIKKQESLFNNNKKEIDTCDENQCHGKSKNNSSTDEDKVFHPLMPLPSNKSRHDNKQTSSPVSKSQSSGHLKEDIRVFSDKRLFEEFRERAASTSALEKNPIAKAKESIGNKTMLMQIGRSDIRLIYPDRRQILFNKCLKDIIHYHSSGGSMGYVFKCQSSSVVNDVVTCLRTAHQFVQERIHRENNRTCVSCPMYMYQQLVRDMDGAATNRLAHSILLKRLDKLPEDERNSIMDKLTGAETSDIEEKNEIILVLLKAYCEIKQKSHKHSIEDAMDNKSIFLNEVGGSILRAKRSLTNSFSDMIKRKNYPIEECDEDIQIRRRSQTVGSAARDTMQREMVGAGSKIALFIRSSNQSSAPLTPNKNFLGAPERMSPSKLSITGTPRVRRDIFKRVVTPAKHKDSSSTPEKRDYKELWKSAIKQQILLIRMERENKKIIASQFEAEERRQKLDYTQILSPVDDWIDFNSNYDLRNLEIKMHKGIPKAKRGDVWKYLSETEEVMALGIAQTILNLTSLGPGQLALYNVLKAYSLLDIEVGYCQGLAFVAGVLLMHTNSEEEAFNLLKHIMFELGFRKQYQSDMIGLQIQMYQISRLLHDVQRDIFDHIEEIGIDPSLYATSWFLTIFASNFPLGFVVRVFDLIFLQGIEGLFKVALCLISISKDSILSCKSLDNLMLFMKTEIPEMKLDKLNQALDQAFSLCFSKQLNSYEIEYHVLQEELLTQSNSSADLDLDSLRSENEELKKKLKKYQDLATTESVLRFLPSNQNTFSRHEIVSLLDKALYVNLENYDLLNNS
ncbi:TBC1D4 [Lepeophtheirus salmonis]|uniref:TBC1D4 n=1 Tax=Lepeophtheirus salmonis TaxID=72036 RepID=A0A7R8CUT9_LEPSM|nr:TBC1D4 [Lepeophtheirus salmonis]CAF2939451.1 TBC1D4 [Lepeophtheirus salmonis]